MRTDPPGPRLLKLGAHLARRAGPPGTHRPDWQQASPAWIAQALERALALPSGGWMVVDASRAIAERPGRYRVAGRDLVTWRVGGRVLVAPDECPHMGARLSDGCVRDGALRCPWHDLALGPEGHGPWRPLPTHDDGVLVWVRCGDEAPTDRPVLAPRPAERFDAVVRMEAACEPRDVVQNRLDPWHGAHFHPHSFAALRVIDQRPDEITVRVAYRIAGPIAMEVDARFHCPEPRTIVMTIVAGEGRDSVVETHATPIEAGRTAIVEATLATSDRPGFRHALRAAGLVRPLIRRAARRLWVEDAAYAERLYELRTRRR